MSLRDFGIKKKICDYTKPYPEYLGKYESKLESLYKNKLLSHQVTFKSIDAMILYVWLKRWKGEATN